MKVKVTYEEVCKHWPDGIPRFTDRYKKAPDKWGWYYEASYAIPSREGCVALGKGPETRVRNFLKRNAGAMWVSGKIGGGEVFRLNVVSWQVARMISRSDPMGIFPHVPDHVLQAFYECERKDQAFLKERGVDDRSRLERTPCR